MIKRNELVAQIKTVVYLCRQRVVIAPEFLDQILELANRIKRGEPILEESEEFYQIHGQGD